MDNLILYALAHCGEGGGGGGTVKNPALRLIDWEGTVLKEYTATQAENLTDLPTPESLNANVDRELLTFQEYNWSVNDIKAWVTAHEGQCLTIGAIYTTADRQDHNYWNNLVFDENMRFVVVQKRGTTSIGANAFQGCTSLESINIPDGVTSIGNNAFQSCASLKSINIPDGVTSIGNNAFYYCTSLESINIPDGVTSIGANAFQSCTSLKSINIPDGVTSIGNSAFYYCASLESINIPDGVTSIGANAFYYCTSLNGIVIKGMPTLSNTNSFSNIYNNCLIFVPRSNLSWFETATNWATFYVQGKIVAIEDNVEYLRAIGIDV